MTILQDITNSRLAHPRLNLVHTTTAAAFREICASGQLSPQQCPVMNHLLTYLFYGRAAYRPGHLEETNKDRDSRPVFLLFRAEAIGAPYAVYPCDTGAHQYGLYSPHLDGIEYHDLECSALEFAEQRIVSRYFGTNEDYYFGAALEKLEPEPTSAVARAFYALLTSNDVRRHDDRCLTIEVQQTNELVLAGTTLGALLVPDYLSVEPDVHSVVESCELEGVKVSTYRPQTITNAARTVEQEFQTVWRLQMA